MPEVDRYFLRIRNSCQFLKSHNKMEEKEMIKRILSVLLAVLILINSVPLPARAEEGEKHTVSLSSDLDGKSIGIGDTVSVKVMVEGTDSSVTSYNAYDLKLSYDAEQLTFISGTAADKDAEITSENSRIRVKGYGDDKNFSTTAVTLRFRAAKPGSTTISLLHAKVDLSDHAGYHNAPEVTIKEGASTITVPVEGFEVQVEGEGVKVPGGSYVAISGEDFIFNLEDYKLYDYEVEVSVDGVDITSVVKVDKKTGTYTIPKREIDGVIKITVKRSPAVFTVTLSGSDVSGEKAAEYNTDYVFMLKRESGYLYTITVTIDGKEYTGYRLEENTYIIPGTDICGNIRIKVTKNEDDSGKVFVDFIGTGGKDGSGQKKTKLGVEYPFTIKKKKGYTYSVTVFVDGKRTPYDYDWNLDTYYILSENVTGNIQIVIGKVSTVEAVEYITMDEQSLFLIVYNGIINEGQVPRYDGRSMYWSDKYRAYVWLVTSNASEKKVKKEAEGKITVTEGTTAGDIDYSGNVNMTLQTDLADAELVWEMYKAKHSLDFMEMRKFLNADVYPDRKLNVRDVAAILKKIS